MNRNFRVAEVFEEWDEAFLNSYGIHNVGSVFLFDMDEVTHIASTQPSYFGRFLYYNVYMKDDDADDYESDLAHEAVMDEPGEDDYFSNIPEGHSFSAPLMDDEPYEEFVESWVDYLKANPPL